jgi:hypothetical protein
MTTGKWADPGVPHKGWTWLGSEDLGEPSEICEMCEVQEIRHVHFVSHPDYPKGLRVGCVCAENLTADNVRPRRAEASAKRRAKRQQRFIEAGWKDGRYGSQSKSWKQNRLLIAPRGSGWIAKANDEGGRKRFPTADAAKVALFAHFDPPAS